LSICLSIIWVWFFPVCMRYYHAVSNLAAVSLCVQCCLPCLLGAVAQGGWLITGQQACGRGKTVITITGERTEEPWLVRQVLLPNNSTEHSRSRLRQQDTAKKKSVVGCSKWKLAPSSQTRQTKDFFLRILRSSKTGIGGPISINALPIIRPAEQEWTSLPFEV